VRWRLQGLFQGLSFWEKAKSMKKKKQKQMDQPAPFTPGITKSMVRQHVFEMFRDKLPDHPLTLEDWVLAEKALVNSMETEEIAS